MNKEKKDKDQDKLADRMSSLEKEYKRISEKIIHLEGGNKEKPLRTKFSSEESLREHIAMLEQERVTLLEQITSLEEQHVMAIEVEQERNNLQETVQEMEKEKQNLIKDIDQVREEKKELQEKISRLENLKNAFYIQKERQDMEQQIANLKFENNNLSEKIIEYEKSEKEFKEKLRTLEGQGKALTYLDQKSQMYKAELNEVEQENERLREKIKLFDSKHAGFVEKITGLERKLSSTAHSDKSTKNLVETDIIVENRDLRKKITEFDLKHTGFVEKIKDLEKQLSMLNKMVKTNEELVQKTLNQEKTIKELKQQISKLEFEKDSLSNKSKKTLPFLQATQDDKSAVKRIAELEEERLHLFKIIGKLEEEKKTLPFLDKRNAILEEELIKSEQEKNEIKKQIAKFEKQHKEMSEKIAMLEEKRNTRFLLEQENGLLQKKIKDIELKLQKALQVQRETEDKNVQVNNIKDESECFRKEIAKNVFEKNNLLKQVEELVEERLQLMKKLSEFSNIEQAMLKDIGELKAEQQRLLKVIEKYQQQSQGTYVLDKEKLDELKEFTLEAIQARRWKSAEFVNGAYDAIGLFYRSLLADRPIKKSIK